MPVIGKDYDFMYRLCKERKIKIGRAFCGQKFMGLCISDKDGDAIIKEFLAIEEPKGEK
jgi:hypothetical protein